MDDKISDLMTKLYSEMQHGFGEIKQDLVRIDHKMDDNHKALYDGFIQNTESINNIRQ